MIQSIELWECNIFLFLSFSMLQEVISNDQMEYESQSSSYKQDTGLTVLCQVNMARGLFLFT